MLDTTYETRYNAVMSRETDSLNRLLGDSLEEIKGGLEDEARRLSRAQRMRFGGHKIWPGNLLNFLACWYLSQSPEERRRIAAVGMGIFAEHLESERPIPFEERATTTVTVTGRSLNPTTGEPIDVLAPPQKKDTA
jgi:hypothetical protein